MSDKNPHAHIIVIGNEKGGTGKSTIAMHLAIKLLNEGFSVATMDFDGRQGSLSKYVQNRKNFAPQTAFISASPSTILSNRLQTMPKSPTTLTGYMT